MNLEEDVKNSEMDQEKAQALLLKLTKIPDTPGHLRSTLGSENVAEYFKLITSQEVVEPDWFFMTGKLSLHQVDQYMHLSGDHEKIFGRLQNLAKKMATGFSKKLPEMVKNDIKGDKKRGLQNLFQSIENLKQYTLPELGTFLSSNVYFERTFKNALFSLIGVELMQLAEKPEYQNIRQAIYNFIDFANRLTIEKEGIQFLAIQLKNEMDFYRAALLDPRNQKQLDDVIGYKQALNPQEVDEMNAANELSLEEIRKEASYKKILFNKFHTGNPQIAFMGDDFSEKHRYVSFCAFRISFNPSFDLGLPNVIKDTSGNLLYDFRNIHGVVNCTLNPNTGELLLITNKGVNLGEILEPQRYLLLKTYLIGELKKYLVEKDPDIDDLFALNAYEKAEETHADVQNVITEDLTGQQHEKNVVPTWTYTPYQKPEQADDTDHPDVDAEGLKQLSKHKRKVIIDKIWGASGSEALAAIKRLLKSEGGDEIRQEGSHLFLYSKRTNQTLPIPVSDRIPPPLVMSNIQKWGYSLVEYGRELGAKV